jgi:hypothetical protein
VQVRGLRTPDVSARIRARAGAVATTLATSPAASAGLSVGVTVERRRRHGSVATLSVTGLLDGPRVSTVHSCRMRTSWLAQPWGCTAEGRSVAPRPGVAPQTTGRRDLHDAPSGGRSLPAARRCRPHEAQRPAVTEVGEPILAAWDSGQILGLLEPAVEEHRALRAEIGRSPRRYRLAARTVRGHGGLHAPRGRPGSTHQPRAGRASEGGAGCAPEQRPCWRIRRRSHELSRVREVPRMLVDVLGEAPGSTGRSAAGRVVAMSARSVRPNPSGHTATAAPGP